MAKLHIIGGALIACLLAVAIGAGLIGGAGFAPDVEAISQLQAWRSQSPSLTSLVIALTQFGSAYVTIGAGLLAAGWLALKRDRARAMVLAGAVIGERLMIDGLKLVIERARPALDAHPVMTNSSSFPSGHAGNTMAGFLSIALIAAPPAWRRSAVVVAAALSVAIGLTRPYLGVHWPSDVVGGWSLGIVIALLAWRIAERRAPQQQH
ncbi:MAG: phosphatase PAP2 family protein [Sphingomonas bacterium]|nr:phosphatase PAP2 family protein [Sphingomonas bacterium]